MGGGELELAIAGGQMDAYFTEGTSIQPKVSFFKSVYKKYHNFSQESVTLQFDKERVSETSDSLWICDIIRHGQLLHHLCCTIVLPELKYYQPETPNNDYIYQCKWIDNLGPSIIKTAELLIGGNIIQTLSGEWIWAFNKLYEDAKTREAFDHISGQNSDVNDPYTSSTITQEPINRSRPSRKICIPLPFFTMNSATSLPLVALQYAKVQIRLTIRPIKELILVRKIKDATKPLEPVIDSFSLNNTNKKASFSVSNVEVNSQLFYTLTVVAANNVTSFIQHDVEMTTPTRDFTDIDIDNLPDGTITVSIKLRDAAGNETNEIESNPLTKFEYVPSDFTVDTSFTNIGTNQFKITLTIVGAQEDEVVKYRHNQNDYIENALTTESHEIVIDIPNTSGIPEEGMSITIDAVASKNNIEGNTVSLSWLILQDDIEFPRTFNEGEPTVILYPFN